MIPVVNTDVKMSKKMMHSLNIFEAVCAVRGVNEVSETDVTIFLTEKYGPKIADLFKPEYLFKNPAAALGPQ